MALFVVPNTIFSCALESTRSVKYRLRSSEPLTCTIAHASQNYPKVAAVAHYTQLLFNLTMR